MIPLTGHRDHPASPETRLAGLIRIRRKGNGDRDGCPIADRRADHCFRSIGARGATCVLPVPLCQWCLRNWRLTQGTKP